MGNIAATPRNRLLGLLADALGSANDFATENNPPVRMLSNAIGVPGLQRTLNELSYGGALGTGSGMTWKPKDDTVDAVGLLAPAAVASKDVKFMGSGDGVNSLLGQFGAIDPKGQKRLVEGLLGNGDGQRYRLGDINAAQSKDAYVFGGSPVGESKNVFATPDVFESHVDETRVQKDNFQPTEVGLFTKQSMRPDSTVIPPVRRGDYPMLTSQTMTDPVTGAKYRAQMALKPVDDGFEAITVIPQGLAARKKPR